MKPKTKTDRIQDIKWLHDGAAAAAAHAVKQIADISTTVKCCCENPEKLNREQLEKLINDLSILNCKLHGINNELNRIDDDLIKSAHEIACVA
jgi:hypothetical protein